MIPIRLKVAFGGVVLTGLLTALTISSCKGRSGMESTALAEESGENNNAFQDAVGVYLWQVIGQAGDTHVTQPPSGQPMMSRFIINAEVAGKSVVLNVVPTTPDAALALKALPNGGGGQKVALDGTIMPMPGVDSDEYLYMYATNVVAISDGPIGGVRP